MKYRILSPLVALTMLSACTTLDPYTGEEKTSSATKGAVGGAIVGALVGALTNTSDGDQTRRNALIGAGLGALTGAAAGNYMDQQEAALRAELEGTGVSVTRAGENIVLNMPGNITFDTDSDMINSSFYEVLDSVAIVLNKFESTYVDVNGHTDSTGSDEHNNELSRRRAASVATYLESQNVIWDRMVVRGFGERSPIADNGTTAGRQQNRRVEIQIAPYTG